MHSHAHGSGNTSRVLRIALLLTAAYIVVLIVAGIRAKSLALLSEAGHNGSDFLALLLSWAAAYIQERPPSARRTFGYHRAGVLAALVNASTLVLIALFIFYEAIQRLQHPVEVHSGVMIVVAAVGVVLNGGIAWLLMRTHADLNIRSAVIHEIGDTLATLAVILGGLGIALTGNNFIDPALSILIGVMILWSSFGIIRESLNILLEGTPLGMKLENVESALRSVPGVNNVHDLHIWSIGSETHALSCHIAVEDIPLSESETIMRAVRQMLSSQFNIHHTTIQFEHVVCDIAHGCIIVPEPEQRHTH